MRRLLNQLAHAAVRKENCQLQIAFRRLSARLGYAKAVWAIAHRLCRLIGKVLHAAINESLHAALYVRHFQFGFLV
jgi:hypothetical protein